MQIPVFNPCTKKHAAGERIGAACEECGHTNVVHPGYGNPSVFECLLCRLEDLTSPPMRIMLNS